MPTIGNEASAPMKQPIDASSHANLETPDPSEQRRVVIRLDDQMNMIVLDGKLDDPELMTPFIRRGDRDSDRWKHELRPQ
jgi:hypothetical protein